MRVTKKWQRELNSIVKELYSADVEYYNVRENKTYVSKGKTKSSNSLSTGEEESAAARKVGQLENKLLMHIRGIADKQGAKEAKDGKHDA